MKECWISGSQPTKAQDNICKNIPTDLIAQVLKALQTRNNNLILTWNIQQYRSKFIPPNLSNFRDQIVNSVQDAIDTWIQNRWSQFSSYIPKIKILNNSLEISFHLLERKRIHQITPILLLNTSDNTNLKKIQMFHIFYFLFQFLVSP